AFAVLALCATLLASSARAERLGLCATDGDRDDASAAANPSDDNDGDEVPCGFADGGLLGPSCFDAKGYVLSTSGLLLCTMPLGLRIAAGPAPVVTPSPAATHAAPDAWSAVAVAPPLRDLPPGATVVDVARAVDVSRGPPPGPPPDPRIVPS